MLIVSADRLSVRLFFSLSPLTASHLDHKGPDLLPLLIPVALGRGGCSQAESSDHFVYALPE